MFLKNHRWCFFSGERRWKQSSLVDVNGGKRHRNTPTWKTSLCYFLLSFAQPQHLCMDMFDGWSRSSCSHPERKKAARKHTQRQTQTHEYARRLPARRSEPAARTSLFPQACQSAGATREQTAGGRSRAHAHALWSLTGSSVKLLFEGSREPLADEPLNNFLRQA